MSDSDLVPIFIPSLSAILLHHERKKGSPLTEPEVLAIRDKATVMMMPGEKVAKMDESRGYQDIDPELCWLQWQHLRLKLQETQDDA